MMVLFQNAFKFARWAHCLPSPYAELSLLHFAVNFKPEIDDFFSADSLEQEWLDCQLHVGKMGSLEPAYGQRSAYPLRD